jgi:Concanavalin A-like lectin/glucanases superfamily
VLGTRFALSAQPGQSALTVASGQVVFASKADGYGRVIETGERLNVLSAGQSELTILPMDERLALGLIGHWTLDDLNDGLRDLTGTTGDLTATGITLADGRIGAAMRLPENPWPRHAPPPLITPGTELPEVFTVAMWVRWDRDERMPALFANAESGIKTSGIRWVYGRVDVEGHSTDDHALNLEVANGRECTVASSTPLPQEPGVWHHLVLVLDARQGRATFYYDGRDVTLRSGIRRDFQRTQPLSFGALLGSSAHFFPGSLDDLRLYARALSPAEVVALAGSPIP